MGITRRDFIKIAGAAAGTGAGSGLLHSALGADSRGGCSESVTATICEMCHWYCGALARVVDGKVVKLDGNPNHPNSRGKLCARGNAGMGLLYDPDRVKTPLLRTGARGEGKYEQVTWDKALDFVAEKMQALKKAYGPEAICLFTGGGCSSHLMQLIAAFGSPNFGNPAFAQCRGPRDVGFQLTFGDYPGAPERLDLAGSEVIVLFGSHLGENVHNSQVQDFAEAVGRRARLIVVDPRFSTSAGKADYWLPIKPGADLALILTWINILIRESLYDKEYVELYADGFEKLAAAVAECTPEWAEKETDIPSALIIKTALEAGKARPSVCIHPGRHASWYGNDVQRSRALAILTAILGVWGREGGIYLSSKASLKKLPPPKAYPIPEKEALIDLAPYPFAFMAGVTNGITNVARAATITGKPYPIKGWIVMGTNVVRAMPNQKETLEAINKLDLLVTAEILPLDTAMLSDVILPSASYLEQFTDLSFDRGQYLGVCMGKAAVKPLFESRDGYTIARELAKKLGLQDYFPWETLEEKMKDQCKSWKINYDELSKTGYARFKNTNNPYITAENQPLFRTRSGKIELYSHELEKHDFDPVPKYTPVQEPEQGYFRLLYGRSPAHSFSRSTNNPLLTQIDGENEVWINAGKAKALGVKNGQYVVLVNQDGVRSNRVKAKVTQRIRGDCVYMIHGFCSSSKWLRNAYGKGADDQGLITRYAVDPICGSTGMRVNFVKVVVEI